MNAKGEVPMTQSPKCDKPPAPSIPSVHSGYSELASVDVTERIVLDADNIRRGRCDFLVDAIGNVEIGTGP